MTVRHREAGPTVGLALLLGLALFPWAGLSRAQWTFSGEVGAELDSVGEEFGSGATVDDLIDPTDPLDDLSDAIRFQDQTTDPSAVLSLRLRDDQSRRFDGRLRLKSRSETSRAELDLRGELGDGIGRWRWADRVYSEFAGSEADGGWVNLGELGWSAPRLLGNTGVGFRFAHELSRAGDDSLASLFDYQLFRPSIEFAPRVGSVRLTLEAGTQHKRIVDDGDGSYDGSWTELRGYTRRASFSGRLESRSYVHPDSLTPSYQEIWLHSDTTVPLTSRDEARVELSFRSLQYALDSSIFRDHLEAEAGLFWQRELGAPADPVLPNETGAVATPLDDLDAALAELSELEAEYFPALADSNDTNRPAEPGVPGDPTGREGATGEDVANDPSGLDGEGLPGDPASAIAGVSSRSQRRALGNRASAAARSQARWRLELGLLGSGSLGESDDTGDFAQASGRVSLGRHGGDRLWLDLALELGHRDYLEDRAATDLVFEGFDFSVSGSDYGFAEISVFGELQLPAALSFGLFAQYEDQRHDDAADDFRLWILTASLVRKF